MDTERVTGASAMHVARRTSPIFTRSQSIMAMLLESIDRTRALGARLQTEPDRIAAARSAPVQTSDVHLLDMAEGLIAAHKAAKLDNDGRTLDLIEDALFHVGRRLGREYRDKTGATQ